MSLKSAELPQPQEIYSPREVRHSIGGEVRQLILVRIQWRASWVKVKGVRGFKHLTYLGVWK